MSNTTEQLGTRREDEMPRYPNLAQNHARVKALSYPGFTYFVRAGDGGPIKIGRTTDLRQRLSSLRLACPYGCTCIGVLVGDHEARLHERFAGLRIHGEWFTAGAELLEYIESHARKIRKGVTWA